MWHAIRAWCLRVYVSLTRLLGICSWCWWLTRGRWCRSSFCFRSPSTKPRPPTSGSPLSTSCLVCVPPPFPFPYLTHVSFDWLSLSASSKTCDAIPRKHLVIICYANRQHHVQNIHITSNWQTHKNLKNTENTQRNDQKCQNARQVLLTRKKIVVVFLSSISFGTRNLSFRWT